MGTKNDIVSEYSADYRGERLKNNISDYKEEYQINANRPVKKLSHDDVIKHNREIKNYNNNLNCIKSDFRTSNKIDLNKFRAILAIVLLILLITSVAIAITLIDPDFVIDMNLFK